MSSQSLPLYRSGLPFSLWSGSLLSIASSELLIELLQIFAYPLFLPHATGVVPANDSSRDSANYMADGDECICMKHVTDPVLTP